MIHAANRTGGSARRRSGEVEEEQVLPRQKRSICPECLRAINAVLYEEDDHVLMKKYCSRHGTFTELISSDARLYTLQIQRDRSRTRIPSPRAGKGPGARETRLPRQKSNARSQQRH